MSLVDEFFKRDLNESEAQALDSLLEGSPEESARFAGLLEKEYFSLGLPAPQMPSRLEVPLPGPSPLLQALAVGALLSAAAVTWWLWPAPKAALVAPRAALPAATVPHRLPALPAPPPAVPEEVTGPSPAGDRLNVVVDLDDPAPVEVDVLGAQGGPLRVLYQGTLPAGRWSVKWDGRLADGSPAPAGDYRIQVLSGESRMTRTVSVAPAP
ncbi:MAG TPA: FlgD immunoglobulin-like domain containing protein [bacterium]|nr:FlgD immunoglobulin-like domain containing protein [bacterium]